MKLESKFDYKALRKAQSKVTRKFNLAAKAIEKLELGEEDVKTMEAILTKNFDQALSKISVEPTATAAAPAGEGAAPGATPAEGGGFV